MWEVQHTPCLRPGSILFAHVFETVVGPQGSRSDCSPAWHHLPTRHLCPGLMASRTRSASTSSGPPALSPMLDRPRGPQLIRPELSCHSSVLRSLVVQQRLQRTPVTLGGRVSARQTHLTPRQRPQHTRRSPPARGPLPLPRMSGLGVLRRPTPHVSPVCCLLPPRVVKRVGSQSTLGGVSLQGSTAGHQGTCPSGSVACNVPVL